VVIATKFNALFDESSRQVTGADSSSVSLEKGIYAGLLRRLHMSKQMGGLQAQQEKVWI
jgi:hypothetical protein